MLHVNKIYLRSKVPQEFKVVGVRECPVPAKLRVIDNPSQAAEYWNRHVKRHPFFNPEAECCAVLLMNAQMKIRGHVLVSVGTVNCCLVHAREVFRAAIIGSSVSIILMHNHPSGHPSPSIEDITVTRKMSRAGILLGITLQDHVIVGHRQHYSMNAHGHLNGPSPVRPSAKKERREAWDQV